ncbi:MAG: hypothetical protein CMJ21_01255 [Phycisphaerae bacterium]|jgi:hypothetical protein|nr:hypothetical protein [Phycisphaerae bacterium]
MAISSRGAFEHENENRGEPANAPHRGGPNQNDPYTGNDKMKQLTPFMIVLTMILTSGWVTPAASAVTDTEPIALVHSFPLRVKAALSRTHLTTTSLSTAQHHHPIVFRGKGRAHVTHNGVTLHFDVLYAGRRGKAKVQFDNPAGWQPHRPHFKAIGRARVKLDHADVVFDFKVATKGTIIRAQCGDLLLVGRFVSRSSSVPGTRFSGVYGGIEQ